MSTIIRVTDITPISTISIAPMAAVYGRRSASLTMDITAAVSRNANAILIFA
jgi:hypothetical protein